MSILHTRLFGPAPDHTPASPVGIRFARLRAATSLDIAKSFTIGAVISYVIALADMGVRIYFIARVIVPGAAARRMLAETAEIAVHAFPEVLITVAFMFFLFPPAFRWFFDRQLKRLTREPSRRDRRLRRKSRAVVMIVTLFLVALLAVASAVGSWGGVAFVTSRAAAFAGSMLLPFALFFNRRGVHLTCARCGYPMSTWQGAPDRCHECGSPWKEPWRARLGVRHKSPRLIALGAGMILASLAISAIGALFMK